MDELIERLKKFVGGLEKGGRDKLIAIAKMRYLGWAFEEQKTNDAVEVGLLTVTRRSDGKETYLLVVLDERDGEEDESGVAFIGELCDLDVDGLYDIGLTSRKPAIKELHPFKKKVAKGKEDE